MKYVNKHFNFLSAGVLAVLLLIALAARTEPPAKTTVPPSLPVPQSSEKATAPKEPKTEQPLQEEQEGQSGQEVQPTTGPAGEELVYLNVQDADIKDVIKQISKATSKNFIIDNKVSGKVTIISERPMTREEAYQTFLSALEVAGFTIVKGPAGVIKIVPLKDAVKSPIPTHVDSTPITDMFITRLIPLQNISAVDMSNAIKDLISPEARLFAYPATNTLILTDSGSNIDRLMKIIKELDQEGPQQVLEIIPVNNASARDVAQMVNQLFEQQKAAGVTARTGTKKSGELEEIAEVSKIIPDERTNAIIVLASRRAIDKVRSIISKLDRKMDEAQEGKIHVYYLKHAKAKELAETLSTLTSNATAKKDAKAGAAAGPILAEFEGGMKITADEPTNSLVVTATPNDYQTLIDKVVSKLDVQRRQVYLEAVIMELTVKKQKSYGLGGAFGGLTKGPVRVFGSDPYSGALGGFLSGSGGLPSHLLGGLLGRDTIPITVGNETRNIPSIGVFLSAWAEYGDSNILSTPNILTLDNQEASIEVKEKAYYQGNPTITGSGLQQLSTQSAEAGLILKITPQIGEADNVRLKIDQTLSGFTRAPSESDKVPPPSKERKISTTAVTRDGQTVVLGGLMEDKVSNSKKKVPLLGDIPILGNLFKQTEQSNEKVNLLVFITPHILKDTSDFSSILKRKIEERNKFIEDNYGKRQRSAIRASIKSHREDLLEFKDGVTGITEGASSATAPLITPAAQPPPAKAPVITAPQQPQTELGETSKAIMPAQKPLATAEEPTAPVQKAPQAAVKTPVVTAPSSAAPSVTPPTGQTTAPARVKAPVINVKPPAPGARGEELDLSY